MDHVESEGLPYARFSRRYISDEPDGLHGITTNNQTLEFRDLIVPRFEARVIEYLASALPGEMDGEDIMAFRNKAYRE